LAIKVCISGVTGWTGSAIARAVIASAEFELVGAVARRSVGQDAGEAIGQASIGVRISSAIDDALTGADVMIDYTHPGAVLGNVEAAIQRGVASVIGTSGLSGTDYVGIDAKARKAGVGVIAAGNFSLTAALAKHFAGIAARHIPHWEIIDYAHGAKPDAPSGTARELAEFLGERARNEHQHPPDQVLGAREARGATIGGAQVHSIRLPSYLVSFEAIFGLPNERLSIRHDSGSGAEPYVNGTLLAAKRAVTTRGLVRGLDTLLFGEGGETSPAGA
jgi:4-hydroxy-tetrahydrodipicolinate reductase